VLGFTPTLVQSGVATFVVAHKVATIGSWPSFLGNEGSKSSFVIVASMLSQWLNSGDLFLIALKLQRPFIISFLFSQFCEISPIKKVLIQSWHLS
jgi:hypothetical protein